MTRILRILVKNENELKATLTTLCPATLIVDIEPIIAPWDSDATRFIEGAKKFYAAIAAYAPTVTEVILASNSGKPRPRIPPGLDLLRLVVVKARKPWRTSYARNKTRPIAVLGDQVLTDGLLAWRLRATFVQCEACVSVPWWPRAQAWLGRSMVHILFSTDRGAGEKREVR